MAKYARFEPSAGRAPLDVVVRPAVDDDASAIAALVLARQGGDLGELTARSRREIAAVVPDGDHQLFVAAPAEGPIVAFGRCDLREMGPHAPDGMYLQGSIVDEGVRRRGVARTMMRHRLAWAWRRGHRTVYSFINASNRASEALHLAVGFTELTREFQTPGTDFAPGEGILFVYRIDDAD